VQTTVAPASPSATAMPRPAPRVAPATTATRPRRASRFGVQPMCRVCQIQRSASGRPRRSRGIAPTTPSSYGSWVHDRRAGLCGHGRLDRQRARATPWAARGRPAGARARAAACRGAARSTEIGQGVRRPGPGSAPRRGGPGRASRCGAPDAAHRAPRRAILGWAPCRIRISGRESSLAADSPSACSGREPGLRKCRPR
jgi:hypothetical protein